MMFSGVIALILALFVMVYFPAATILILAVIIGFNMVTYGISILILAYKAGKECN